MTQSLATNGREVTQLKTQKAMRDGKEFVERS